MFRKYFIIFYEDLDRTLAEMGIRKEEYNNSEKHIYALTYSFCTRCNKKELKEIINILGKKSVRVIKVFKDFAYKQNFISYEFVFDYLCGVQLEELSKEMKSE